MKDPQKAINPGKTKMPDPPKRPKFRTLSNVKKVLVTIPYFLKGNVDDTITDETEALRLAISSEENFIVLLRPLTMRDYIEFENRYGENIESFLYKIFFVIQDVSKAVIQPKDGETPAQSSVQLQDGVIKTPFGDLFGSLPRNVAELCAFILSRGGRIVGMHDDGTYETSPVTPDEIIDMLDPKAFYEVNEEESYNPFHEILNVSQVWMADEVATDLEENDELSSEEAKSITNFPSQTEEGSLSNEQPNPSESNDS